MASTFSRTSASGLIRATMYLAQFFAIMLLIMVVYRSLDYKIPHGLLVRVVRPGVKPLRSPGIQPLRVRVVVDGLLVDSKLIRTGELLRSESMRRPPDWPVYVEADPHLESVRWRRQLTPFARRTPG